jgi:hypothetical protein
MNRKIKYLFSINTGRSGSKYVQQLLTHVWGCASFHEPVPIGNGKPMRLFLAGNPQPMRALVLKKLERIQETVSHSEIYAETNHAFIKGFGWLLPEYLPPSQMGVIVLTRKKQAIIKSMASIQSTPLRPGAENWLMTPDMANPLVSPPKHFLSAKFDYRLLKTIATLFAEYPKRLAAYELECIEWYIQETQARGELYQQTWRDITYYSVDVEELNTMSGVMRLLDFFGLEADNSLEQSIGQPMNKPTGGVYPHPLKQTLYHWRSALNRAPSVQE